MIIAIAVVMFFASLIVWIEESIQKLDDPRVLKYQVPYTDSYDGEVVICTYWREYREWRRKWLTWTSLFARKKQYLEIQFDREVGKRKGEWKGGCIGCSYDLLPNETDLECIRRMERERKF